MSELWEREREVYAAWLDQQDRGIDPDAYLQSAAVARELLKPLNIYGADLRQFAVTITIEGYSLTTRPYERYDPYAEPETFRLSVEFSEVGDVLRMVGYLGKQKRHLREIADLWPLIRAHKFDQKESTRG
ncbi:hypothetical protein EON81_14960 [bacterium]|nr:MAG: hypothetical protein EON81_14960 [bacterium]